MAQGPVGLVVMDGDPKGAAPCWPPYSSRTPHRPIQAPRSLGTSGDRRTEPATHYLGPAILRSRAVRVAPGRQVVPALTFLLLLSLLAAPLYFAGVGAVSPSPWGVRAGAMVNGPRAAAVPWSPQAPASTPRNCSSSKLDSLSIAPDQLTIDGLKSQSFTAEATDACGTVLTDSTHFSWQLLPSALGELSSVSSTPTTYTACLSPMGGELELKGTYGGVTLTRNATISVIYTAPSGGSPSPTPDPTPSSSSTEPNPTTSFLVLLSVVVPMSCIMVWALRRSSRAGEELDDEAVDADEGRPEEQAEGAGGAAGGSEGSGAGEDLAEGSSEEKGP